MRHDFLDRYSRLPSPVHRWPAGLKLVSALIFVIVIVLTPLALRWVFVGVAIGLVVVALATRIPLGYLGNRLLLVEPFVFGLAVLTLLQPGGWAIFLGIVLKSTLCLMTMVLLASSTPVAELVRVLRRVRVPTLLVTTVALLYRYLFVLLDEMERMNRARHSRTFTRHRWRTWKNLASVIGQLFVRSTERAERIYAAMCARGWK